MLKNRWQIIEKILSAIALVIVVAIFLKAIIDMDTNYDIGWYQLPFAARIWGIIPKEAFLAENLIEHRYDGFPLLANFFQGLLWKLTGRMQAANLVCYFSLIIYFLYLRSYFKIPLYLSVIAIFTIPAVLTHATTSFVDLPGNIGVSVVIMMIYNWFRQSRLPTPQEVLAAFLGAATAANTKPQLQPLVFIICLVAGARLIWLYLKYTNSHQRRLGLTIPLAIIASALIFATPIKNIAVYGNPFYPIKVEIAGIVLNHKLTPDTYNQGNRPQKWLQSIFEINTPQWTADQWNQGNPKHLDRAGGFFGAYVIFNLLLLLGLTIEEQIRNRRLSLEKKSRNATCALITALVMSVIPANFPQSHELRYFMFWMIVLVSLNLYIVTAIDTEASRWLQPKYLGVVCLIFLTIVYSKISDFYIKPAFVTIPSFINNNNYVKTELLKQMIPNERVCLIGRHGISNPNAVAVAQIQNTFYYSSYFHPEINYEYSIKAAVDPRDCGNLKIIPTNLKKLP
ncbi:hypothetical protein NIES4102_02700 [Chondrocystis sp. NIES-4102]|nr:hypothetical protein NIES4102_02700 [Chondrocystis sp. NIES-4102]